MKYYIYMDYIKQTIEGYNKIAQDWHGTRRKPWSEVTQMITKYIGELTEHGHPNIHILDLGCGNGRLIDTIKSFNISYTGVDPSSELINICKANYHNDNYTFLVNDGIHIAKYINEEGDSAINFDIIISLAVLHHIPQAMQSAWLQEVTNVMNDNSIFIFSVWQIAPNLNHKVEGTSGKNATVHKKINDKEHMLGFAQYSDIRYVYNFGIDELISLLGDNDLHVIEHKVEKRPNSENRNLIFVCRRSHVAS